jgi:mono/diheme cytochrome c family protein
MKFSTITFALAGAACAVLVLAILMWPWIRPPAQQINVKVPALSEIAARGKVTFDANCAPCHGANAAGTDQGPPLVHDIYNPGHHADGAFFLAAKLGVRQHHWSFGNMPPQPQVTEEQVAAIVQYVRELQIANGITEHPHRM